MKKLVLGFAFISLGFANTSCLSQNVFKNLVNEKLSRLNYCLTANKYFNVEIKDDWGEYEKVKLPASQAVLAMREKREKIEFNRDLERGYLLAYIVKNSYHMFDNFFKTDSDKDDEIFYLNTLLSSWLRNSGNYGYIPLIDINVENLQTRESKFVKKVGASQLANGLITYLASSTNKKDLKKRILLLSAYLLAHTKGDITYYLDSDVLKELYDENGHSILFMFIRDILKNTKNPKIQNLIYLLATKNSHLIKYMLNDKDTKELFNQIMKFYKEVKLC
jgi:hypothetical protein